MAVTPHPYALTTLETVKTDLSVPSSNTKYDDLLQRFINLATERIERFTDRMLSQRTDLEEYHSGLAANRVLLGQWPAEKPSEVWIDSSSQFTDASKQLDPTEYNVIQNSRGEGYELVLLSGCSYRLFPKGTRNIKVVYNAGYSPIPDDLEGLCIATVDWLYKTRADDSMNVQTKGKNQENVTFLEDLPLFFQEILNYYRRGLEYSRSLYTG